MRLKMTFVADDVSSKSPDIQSVAALFATMFGNIARNTKAARHLAENKMRLTAAGTDDKREKFTAFQSHLTARTTTGFSTFEAFKTFVAPRLNTQYRTAALVGASGMDLVKAPVETVVLTTQLLNNRQVITVTVTNPLTRVRATEKIGEILIEEARFQPCATVYAGVLNPVFTRIDGSPREYIKLTLGSGDVYVRRYVIRGLNFGDAANILNNQDLQASSSDTTLTSNEVKTAEKQGRFPGTAGATISLGDQLLSHTRGWKKRFISTTLTHKKIVSTKGEFNSAFGALLIDLAKVDATTLFDIHTPRALQHYGVFKGDLLQLPKTTSAKYRNLQDEKLLSAYDAVRTRELLIKGSIPHGALLYQDLGLLVVAVGCGDFVQKATLFSDLLQHWNSNALPAPVIDELQYEIGFKKWVFYRFDNLANAATALDQAVTLISTKKAKQTQAFTLHSYAFPAPIPAGATTA